MRTEDMIVPNTNLKARNRSNSKVAMNKDSIRCYRSKEYDHFVNECPNTVTDDSDDYESDESSFLQLMTAEKQKFMKILTLPD